jgi:hypothetical protein
LPIGSIFSLPNQCQKPFILSQAIQIGIGFSRHSIYSSAEELVAIGKEQLDPADVGTVEAHSLNSH